MMKIDMFYSSHSTELECPSSSSAMYVCCLPHTCRSNCDRSSDDKTVQVLPCPIPSTLNQVFFVFVWKLGSHERTKILGQTTIENKVKGEPTDLQPGTWFRKSYRTPDLLTEEQLLSFDILVLYTGSIYSIVCWKIMNPTRSNTTKKTRGGNRIAAWSVRHCRMCTCKITMTIIHHSNLLREKLLCNKIPLDELN